MTDGPFDIKPLLIDLPAGYQWTVSTREIDGIIETTFSTVIGDDPDRPLRDYRELDLALLFGLQGPCDGDIAAP